MHQILYVRNIFMCEVFCAERKGKYTHPSSGTSFLSPHYTKQADPLCLFGFKLFKLIGRKPLFPLCILSLEFRYSPEIQALKLPYWKSKHFVLCQVYFVGLVLTNSRSRRRMVDLPTTRGQSHRLGCFIVQDSRDRHQSSSWSLRWS